MSSLPFDNPYRHGFARVAVAIPTLRVADPARNARALLELARRAADRGAALAVFPELGITGYSCDDLFHQSALIEAAETAVGAVIEASKDLGAVLVVGAPLRRAGRLFNCAVVVHRGRVLGVVPKSYLPTYREFYERGSFAADDDRRPTADARRAGGRRSAPTSSSRRPTCPASAPRRDLRGPVGADPPSSRRGAGRRHRAGQPVRRATSPSARRRTGACCARAHSGAASPPTSTRPRARASRPPTWRGTARDDLRERRSCSPRRERFPPTGPSR
jgi:hypothetical protein